MASVRSGLSLELGCLLLIHDDGSRPRAVAGVMCGTSMLEVLDGSFMTFVHCV